MKGPHLRAPAAMARVLVPSLLLLILASLASAGAAAQEQVPRTAADPQPAWSPTHPGSANIQMISNLRLGPRLSVSDIRIEQDLNRPFAYVSRFQYGERGPRGLDIIDLSDEHRPEVIYRWRIENQELHVGTGGHDPNYFKLDDRYYVVQSTQFGAGGPNTDLGAVVLDVTGLPDTTGIEEVARIREPDYPGGFHNAFTYKHSDGGVYLFTTVQGPHSNVYDLRRVVEGDVDGALVARIPVPDNPLTGTEIERLRGYHDIMVQWHPDTGTDRFYGGGTGGYYIFDVTDLQNPELMVTLTNIRGINYGHSFTPDPEGRYMVGEVEYQTAPLRIFDIQPALDGEVSNISRPISFWTAHWENLVHNQEVRWPYVFVSGYLDGLQVFSLKDPHNPRTVAYYDTYAGPPNEPPLTAVFNGAFGVDIRNADGLIVVSDMTTGFWAFRMEGFPGWDGRDWGMPNVSRAQDYWDAGEMPSPERWRE